MLVAGIVGIFAGLLYAARTALDSYRFGDAAVEGDYVAIEVSDTGSGMDAETLERIFDPFLHDEIHGPWARAGGGARNRPRPRWRSPDRERAGTRHNFRVLLPAATQAARRRGEGPRTVSFEP